MGPPPHATAPHKINPYLVQIKVKCTFPGPDSYTGDSCYGFCGIEPLWGWAFFVISPNWPGFGICLKEKIISHLVRVGMAYYATSLREKSSTLHVGHSHQSQSPMTSASVHSRSCVARYELAAYALCACTTLYPIRVTESLDASGGLFRKLCHDIPIFLAFGTILLPITRSLIVPCMGLEKTFFHRPFNGRSRRHYSYFLAIIHLLKPAFYHPHPSA